MVSGHRLHHWIIDRKGVHQKELVTAQSHNSGISMLVLLLIH